MSADAVPQHSFILKNAGRRNTVSDRSGSPATPDHGYAPCALGARPQTREQPGNSRKGGGPKVYIHGGVLAEMVPDRPIVAWLVRRRFHLAGCRADAAVKTPYDTHRIRRIRVE